MDNAGADLMSTGEGLESGSGYLESICVGFQSAFAGLVSGREWLKVGAVPSGSKTSKSRSRHR